ncbi:MAG: biotin--[acetyl-CoA-carboxylase] ligase [Candidatus Kapaibacteriales bacterium]
MIQPKRFHFDILTSTNDYAKALLEKEDFVVVTANYQTHGKGRNNNKWEGEYGKNLYYSFGVKFNKFIYPEESYYLQGLGSLAVLETLKELFPKQRFCLKYPNDVHALSFEGDFRKISGILVEHLFIGELCQSTIIGIGINIKQKQFPDFENNKAISLALLGESIEIETIVNVLTNRIIALFDLLPNEIVKIWQNELNLLNKKVELIGDDGIFFVKGFDPFGRLIVWNNETKVELIVENINSIRYELK